MVKFTATLPNLFPLCSLHKKIMKSIKKILHQPFFIKLFNWEYWPFNVVYGPIYLYWVGLCIRARSFFFFNTSNPSIKNGGFLLESKKEIYDIMPPHFYPPTLFLKTGAGETEIKNALQKTNLSSCNAGVAR